MSDNSADPTVQAEKDRLFFDRIAHKYAKKDLTPSTSIPRKYQLLYAVRPVTVRIGTETTIVDIGCGIGASAQYLAEFCNQYIGIDHSDEMIRIANEMDWGEANTRFIAADIKSPELRRLSADVVLAIGALHHMTDLDTVIEAIKGIAKPGGWFVAIEPQRGNPSINIARWIRKRLDKNYSEDQHFFSAAELGDLCERNGLQNIELEYQCFCSKPFGQVILPVEPLARLASITSVAADKILDRYIPGFLRKLSWDLIIRAQIPDERSNDDR